MPLKAILFDLDDTLLINPMDQFLPRYISAVAAHALKLVPDQEPDFFVKPLLKATRAMTQNVDPAVTNAEVYWEILQAESGVDWLGLNAESHFNRFYEHELEEIRDVTAVPPLAAEIVQWAQTQGWQVVIATNPLYPRRAIETRLRWANLPVTEYDFDLVTYKEIMRATKPHVAYYEQILATIGRQPSEAVMVGDSWKNDIAPTAALGMPNFWLAADHESVPEEGNASGRGNLELFFHMLQTGQFD